MSSEKREIIVAITKKIDELLPRIIRSNNQDLLQIEFKLNKEGMN